MTTATPDSFIKDLTTAEIAVGHIRANGNFRKTFDAKLLKELSASIAKVGVLQPILVREDPDAKNRYVLIAGERRYRAAVDAGLAKVPARVLDVNEQQAAEIQALENLHRKDLSPIEEAKAFKTLLSLGSHTVESLAERIDKSVTYVYRALKLLELPKAAIKGLEEGVITTGHALQIARAPEKNQEALTAYALTKLAYYKRYPTVDELKQQIEKTIEKSLSDAVFPTDVANYGGTDNPACGTCPFNSGNQGVLFEGAEKGSCTNPGCYNKRTATFYHELEDRGAVKWPGLKFVGTAQYGYNDQHAIKGFAVVDHASSKIKDAIADHPEAFGYGILKSGAWSAKAPRLVVVCKDTSIFKTAAGKKIKGAPEIDEPQHRDPRADAKQRFIDQKVQLALMTEAIAKLATKPNTLLDDILIEALNSAYGDRQAVAEALGITSEEEPVDREELPAHIKKLHPGAKVVAIWMLSVGHNTIRLLEEKGIDTKPTIKTAERDGAQLFEERNAKKCADCGCSQDVACQVQKPGGESWEKVGCSWNTMEPSRCTKCLPEKAAKAKKK